MRRICSVWVVVCVACGGGGAGDDDDDVTCPSGDRECFQRHLVLTENGADVPLLTVPASALVPDANSPGVTLFAAGGAGATTVGRFDGVAWTEEALPGTGGVHAVWGSSRDDVWAGGDARQAYHRVGGSWTRLELPLTTWGEDAPNNLADVWGTAAGDVWAVTDLGYTYRYDGTAWSIVPELGAGVHLAVWTAARDDVWVVEDAVVRHLTPSGWTTVPGCCGGAGSIHGSGPNDVWIVGNGVFHWDGTLTSPMSPVGDLRAVWVFAADDVWTAAPGGLHHFDGSGWTPHPQPGVTLVSLWGAATDDLWAGGTAGELLHWDGLEWTAMPDRAHPVMDLFGEGSFRSPDAPPEITNPIEIVDDVLHLVFVDGRECVPAFCLRLCSLGACNARYVCTPGRPGAGPTDAVDFHLSFTARASGPELFALEVVPLSSPDCGPTDETDPIVGPTAEGPLRIGTPTASWDGTYSAMIHTVTPSGTTDTTGTFTCAAGSCSDGTGAFTGTVTDAGDFTGASVVCDACEPLALTGVFSATLPFTLSGASSGVSQTIVATKL